MKPRDSGAPTATIIRLPSDFAKSLFSGLSFPVPKPPQPKPVAPANVKPNGPKDFSHFWDEDHEQEKARREREQGRKILSAAIKPRKKPGALGRLAIKMFQAAGEAVSENVRQGQMAQRKTQAQSDFDAHRRQFSGAAFSKSKNEAWRDESRDEQGQWTRGSAKPLLPANRGRWIGERGDGVWMPRALKVKAHAPQGVRFQNGFPDFSPHVARIEGESGTPQRAEVFFQFHPKRAQDFAKADAMMAQRLQWFKRGGTPNAARMERYRQENKLTGITAKIAKIKVWF